MFTINWTIGGSNSWIGGKVASALFDISYGGGGGGRCWLIMFGFGDFQFGDVCLCVFLGGRGYLLWFY